MRNLAALAALLLIGGCNEYKLSAYTNIDVFFQNPADKVDILLVVDNSCSMADEQARLGASFDQFLTYFVEANVEYQIGVTTTTLVRPPEVPNTGCTTADIAAAPAAGQLAQGLFITPETDNKASVFDSLVRQGICGSANEMGLETARRAFSEPLISTVNTGFLRDDASLSVIFVSDEQDFSPGGVNEYINFFRDIKGQRERNVFNASALVMPEPEDCPGFSGVTPATRYIDLAEQTGGIVGNICDGDFSQVVTDLSLNASRLRDIFYLSQLPALATMVVSVDEADLPCEDGAWWFEMVFDEVEGEERPALVFDRLSLPQPSAKISVRYSTGAADPANFCVQAGS